MKGLDKVLAKAVAYDMSDVMRRYQDNTRLPVDVLKEHEREIKRFLAMSAANPGAYGMRGPLDELWHTFIIFTSSYARFCRALGGEFIHHLPEPPSDTVTKTVTKGAAPKGSYVAFLKDYERLLGEEPPAHLWPRPSGGVMDPSCDTCGIFCYQTCAAMPIGPNKARF